MKRVLILGAGFGGLELAARLSEIARDDVVVTLIDQRAHFAVGFSKIDVLFGRKTVAEVTHPYSRIAPRVLFKQERILKIDAAAKKVVTSGGSHDGDILVVALGADVDASMTAGLAEHGQQFYTLEGAEAAATALAAFSKGRVLISILGAPYKCPPAPFEVALQMRDRFASARDVEIRVTSPAPVPLPISKDGSEALLTLMKERNVTFSPGTLVTSLDGKSAVTAAGERIDFDLFLGVPIHRAPKCVVDAGLAASGGWVAVDANTMESKQFPDVYAIGDVTSIPVGEKAAIPKAGAFADRAARAAADDILFKVKGAGARGKFDGVGACYLEFGDGNVAKIDANFFGGPAPDVKFVGPSKDLLPQKTLFASERIDRWFK